MKQYILFDHDGVLVDTEFWYFKAGEHALADIGLTLDQDQYVRDMDRGLGTWDQARAAGIEVTVVDSVPEALETARGLVGADGQVVVTGSLYVVAEVRTVLVEQAAAAPPAAPG